jgi:hypothetical protein
MQRVSRFSSAIPSAFFVLASFVNGFGPTIFAFQTLLVRSSERPEKRRERRLAKVGNARVRQGSAGTTRPMAQLTLWPPDVKHAPTHPVFGRVNPWGPFASAFTAFDPNPRGDSF